MIKMSRSKIDVNEIVRLRRLGYAQKEIGKHIGVTQQAISFILRKLEESEIGVRI